MADIPHFVRDYRALMQKGLETQSRDEAMAWVVGGGDFVEMGRLQRAIVLKAGLAPGMSMVDVGCGSGRLAYALRDDPVGYLGIDVMPEAIEHARMKAARPDWRFDIVEGLAVPALDASLDYACAFSVFTHLKHEESFVYMQDIARVLKPGGRLLFSFLDFQSNWATFECAIANVHNRIPAPLDQFMDRSWFPAWASKLGMECERLWVDGHSWCLMKKL
jgi:SAM-dependent methyltransferase